ncbi:low temperature requirement protein A, partial [Candidatus Kaiserbacteria bacterium]|nr:low temperature requirement protein A [Candidatus Kaiserbacteria bacterium]
MTSLESAGINKRASWLELFYDLVFVAIIAQFTYAVADQVFTIESLIITVVVGYMIFTAWWGTTVSRNLQDSETTKDRLYVQVLMIFALLLSILMPDIFKEGDVSRFFLAYALVRLIQLFMLLRLYRLKPEEAPVTYNIAQAFAISIGLFVAASFLSLPYALILAVAGLVLELFGPLTTGKGNKT